MMWHKIKSGKAIPCCTELWFRTDENSVASGYFDSSGDLVCITGMAEGQKATHWAWTKRPPRYYRNKIARWWYGLLVRATRARKSEVADG